MTAADLTPVFQSLECKLFDWLLRKDGSYICQSNQTLISMALGRWDEVRVGAEAEAHAYLKGSTESFPSRSDFRQVVKERFRVFFDADEWLSFMPQCDLVLGARIHGNMFAIQSEVAAVCIYHDARTLELCETTGLPSISLDDAEASGSLVDLMERVSFDGEAYDRKRASLAARYCQIFEQAYIEVEPRLRVLAASAA